MDMLVLLLASFGSSWDGSKALSTVAGGFDLDLSEE
jgi:hypothetical protein